MYLYIYCSSAALAASHYSHIYSVEASNTKWLTAAQSVQEPQDCTAEVQSATASHSRLMKAFKTPTGSLHSFIPVYWCCAAAGHFGFEPWPLIDMMIFHYESNTVCNPPEQSHTRRVTQRQDQTCYSGSAQPAQTIRDTANISCSSQDVM